MKYATLGLLFVNVSIGGTLTHFAAPPILMVARPWNWDFAYVIGHFGWRAALAILISTLVCFVVFRKELSSLAARKPVPDEFEPEEAGGAALSLPVPAWITATHILFVGWTVLTAMVRAPSGKPESCA